MESIAQRIRDLRLSNKWTQDELSRKIKLSPKMVSFYELGERTPSRNSLIRLAEVFGVSLEYLLGISHETNAYPSLRDNSPENANESQSVEKIIRGARKLQTADADALLKYAKYMYPEAFD